MDARMLCSENGLSLNHTLVTAKMTTSVNTNDATSHRKAGTRRLLGVRPEPLGSERTVSVSTNFSTTVGSAASSAEKREKFDVRREGSTCRPFAIAGITCSGSCFRIFLEIIKRGSCLRFGASMGAAPVSANNNDAHRP